MIIKYSRSCIPKLDILKIKKFIPNTTTSFRFLKINIPATQNYKVLKESDKVKRDKC